MDTATLVDQDIAEGQRFLDHLVGRGLPICAACWIKPTEDPRASLFIATQLVDQKGAIQAYREVLAVLGSLDDVSLNPADIGLLSENHPLVRDVRALRTRHREVPLRPRVTMFGGMAVDEVYVYPPSETFPGFNQIKGQYPTAELVTINLPNTLRQMSGTPWSKFNPLFGTVNATEFEGKAPETLLLMGADASPADKQFRVAFAYRPEGWNTIFDGQAKLWRKVVVAETNQPLYRPADFGPLAELKSQPVASGV